MDELEQFALELLGAVPALGEALARDGAGLRPDPELPTIWFGAAGSALAELFAGLTETGRAASFEVVERHLAKGSRLMGDFVATGLLEALASAVSGGRLDGPSLARHLGPASRAYLDAWDQLTLGRSSLDPGPGT